jgi:dolichyl-phosphate-mannose--protein O-mannosyl transferase
MSSFALFDDRLLTAVLEYSWVDDNRQVYLIGNPFVWWTSTLAVVLYAAVRGFLILRSQRGYSDFVNCEWILISAYPLYGQLM